MKVFMMQLMRQIQSILIYFFSISSLHFIFKIVMNTSSEENNKEIIVYCKNPAPPSITTTTNDLIIPNKQQNIMKIEYDDCKTN